MMDLKLLKILFLVSVFVTQSSSAGIDLEQEQDMLNFLINVSYDRYLAMEKETCNSVEEVIAALESSLERHIRRVLYDVFSFLDVVCDLSDEGNVMCLNRTANKIVETIDQAKMTFNKTASLAKNKLDYLQKSLIYDTSMVEAKKQKALNGLRNCYHTTSYSSRNACISVYKECLQTKHDSLKTKYNTSLCMDLFEQDIQSAIKDISIEVRKTTENALIDLRNDFRDKDGISCLENFTFPQVPDFTPSVKEQVKTAQSMYIRLKETTEQEITENLEQEYHIRKTYDLQPKSNQFFESELNKRLEPKISEIEKVVRDIMENEKCECKEIDVSEYISEGGRNLTKCFDGLIEQVISELQHTREDIQDLSNDLINRGNIAILHCIDKRNIFMPFSIIDCYKLNFQVTNLQSNKTLMTLRDARKRLAPLLQHLEHNGFTYPCMDEAIRYATLVPNRLKYAYYISCFDDICPGSFGITTSTTPYTIYTETPRSTVTTNIPFLESTTHKEYDEYYEETIAPPYTLDIGGVTGVF